MRRRACHRDNFSRACIVALSLVVAVFPVRGEEQAFPTLVDVEKAAELITDGIRNPADIIEFKGRFVVTELLSNRLAVFDYPDFNGVDHFDPESIGRSFQSPHYMAESPSGGLLISNGWGSSIVQIDDLKGAGWTSFSGKGTKFSAPHGICVDRDGWIYVGDSLNSRLVRFRNMRGDGWQVFGDLDRRIAYTRKLVCRDDGVWISNSYEDRPGLNPGRGSNILRVADFESGRVEELYAVVDSNITGILPLDGNRSLVGVWGKIGKIGMIDFTRNELLLASRIRDGLGIPYGFWMDETNGILFVTHTGALTHGDRRTGAIALHTRQAVK